MCSVIVPHHIFLRHWNNLLVCFSMPRGAHAFPTKHYPVVHQQNMLILLCKHKFVEEEHAPLINANLEDDNTRDLMGACHSTSCCMCLSMR